MVCKSENLPNGEKMAKASSKFCQTLNEPSFLPKTFKSYQIWSQ